ncbi:MAG: Oligopeptide transport ATP-binding protein OppF [Chlamydiae bacterium]|nr:Oligopeptide transport ATP-binding protein OppF [Chlamydiota bacterium]
MTKLLEVTHLKKYFPIRRGIFHSHVGDVKAVDGISFDISPGEIVGLVGESGSGKSTAGLAVIRLLEPTSGHIHFMGHDLVSLNAKQLRALRPSVQMIFQNPLVSLNPRKTIFENIGEALLYHRFAKNREQQVAQVQEILQKIGLPLTALSQYPHQFSGGQQQRISIGRAIAMHPKLIICDEAVSALDLSVQAQILNLLYDLKQTFKLSYLFISHDLSVVQNFCDRVLVMYRGKIVERGEVREIFKNPKHPYTQMLFAAIPKKHPQEKRSILPVQVFADTTSPGCPFFGRCSVAKPACEQFSPPLKELASSHSYSCIH